MAGPVQHIFHFYRDGFRSMRLGRTLWKWILVKIFVLLLLARLFLPDHLQENYATDRQRAAAVLDNLTDRTPVR
jgi:hypothetical protein